MKVFDVVELTTGDKATIIAINNKEYKVDIVDEQGKRKDVRYVKRDEIKSIILKKK